MRDLIITLIVLGSVPFILRRPALGAIMYVWLSIMNPHRLAWGFAHDFPFAMIVAVATVLGLLFRDERWAIPWKAPSVLLLLFTLWMCVTTLFALAPDLAYPQWWRVMKIMVMIFVVLIALNERKHIDWLVWALVISLGFYGVKGGIFTLVGGGTDLVFGPPGSYIEENNALAMALLMTIPLIWYLRMRATKPWQRWALLGAIALCAFSALGSYSRGALVTIGPMAAFLWWKSRHKAMLAILLIVMVPIGVGLMPDKWFDRMATITEYQADASALGRINAWQMTFNLAKDRPIVGGGFQIYEPKIFARYAPDPLNLHAAHSIYFSALGEHGFVGLALLLLLGISTWRCAGWIILNTKGRLELRWLADLALMSQVSLVAYAVGGAFLSVLYFDLPYYLLALMVMVRVQVEKALATKQSVEEPITAGPLPAGLPLNARQT